MKKCLICGEENNDSVAVCSCCQTPFEKILKTDTAEKEADPYRQQNLQNSDDMRKPISSTNVGYSAAAGSTNVQANKKTSCKSLIVSLCGIVGAALVIVLIAFFASQHNDEPSKDTYYDIGNEYEYILPYSDSIYYDRSAIEGMDAEEVQLAINEIYARQGRIFESEPYAGYFDSLSWYYGEYSEEEFDDSWFNEYEHANILLLVEYAKEKGYR